MKPPFDIAADLDTPVSAFLKLAPFQPRFLLESADGGERVGRYSIIGFGEAQHFRLESGAPVDDVTAWLRDAVARAPRPRAPGDDTVFAGGLVGSCAYDVIRRIERLPDSSQPRANEPDLAFVAPQSALVFDHLSRRVAVLHDGSDAERESLRKEVISALRGPVPFKRGRSRHDAPTPSLDRAAYMNAVERVQDYIRAGDVYQLVPSIRFAGECEMDAFEAYRALRLLNPSPYLYYVDLGDDLQIVGSSPEALVKLEGRKATLRPIAGTRPRGRTTELDRALEEELLADPKEAAEHVMLVDLARNDLGRVALPGTVGVNPRSIIERYSHVMHIVSGVEGVLRPEHDCFDLFSATFPAGTVVGAPKVRAMEIIDELEPCRRGPYAGTVGYFGHGGAMDQAIAIRTLVFNKGTYAYQAGAGVVADSKPDMEHAEVLAKSGAMQAALDLAEEGL